ncbi:unnamed protein product [Brassicogethes aeneus]|uniref:Uncharacterized protein n=1 Tax=Brassicogethes aeneus TaxID=1431903 RepID=A0A9P0B6R5_BRAAE|nr:unnamed protein product [Brassicogethes aeneus]
MNSGYVLIFLMSLLLLSESVFVCGPNICHGVKCQVTECKEGETMLKGGWCKCCPVCNKILKEGEQCPQPSPFIGGPPPTIYCDEGLICTDGKCVAGN